jgi:Tfp pilus assembly protein PilX
MWTRITADRPLARAIRAERGFAVPTVMLAMVAVLGLASVAVVASVNSQSGVSRDQDSKSAFAAAEAGYNQALLHYNTIPTESPNTCLVGNPVGAASPSGGWCAPVTRAMAGVAGGSFTYWVKPTQGQIQIVSQGSVDGMTRRVQVVARSSGGRQPFGEYEVIGLNNVTLDSQASIVANPASNGDINLASNASLTCNGSQVGPGHNVTTGSSTTFDCGALSNGTVSLPPVNQGAVPITNSNGNFFSVDPYTSKQPDWNPATRQLTLRSNSTLTLTGANYSLCKLTMESNTQLIVAAGATVRIYFDTPEDCGLASPATQLDMSSNATIAPTDGSSTSVALLFMGSLTRTTRILLSSNTQVNDSCDQNFVLYAPRSDVIFNSNSFYCGAIGARTIYLNSNSDVRTSNLAGEFQVPQTYAQHYEPEQQVECLPTPPDTTPDSGC